MKAHFTTLSQIATWTNGQLVGVDAPVIGIDTDSRCLRTGSLFVALRGPRFDGHDYTTEVAAAGAVGMLVNRKLVTHLPQIIVPDTQTGLENLAAAWRNTLGGRVIAITGSNGKTTTKNLIAAILGKAGTVTATKGNLNNAIGVPLTLLAARDENFLVVEMGANHPGEIAILSAIAKPDVAIITIAGRAHLEGFGSVEGVARAKGEILSGLGANGICVLNGDDQYFPLWQNLAGNRQILTFGSNATADVALEAEEVPLQLSDTGFYTRVRLRTPRGALTLELALAGAHNLKNVLAAVAVAEALGISHAAIKVGLSTTTPVAGRLRPLKGVNDAWLIDDSYNANPDSVRAAIAVLCTLPANRRWLALGDLGELGTDAALLHQQLGADAKAAGITHLWAVGALSAGAVATFGEGGRHFPNRDALSAALANVLNPSDLVLIKGSRSAGMDLVVKTLALH